MNSAADIGEGMVDEAIGWMIALREDGLTGQAATEFQAWLSADERHRLAWSRLEGALTPLQTVSKARLSGQGLIASLNQAEPSRRDILRKGGAALGVALMAGVVADRQFGLHGLAADFRTATGQRRRYALPDGSEMVLNARSDANLAFGPDQRGLDFGQGALWVKVRPHHAQFSLSCGDIALSLHQGMLMMRRNGPTLEAICLQGEGLLYRDGQLAATVGAQQGYVHRAGQLSPMASSDVSDAARWTEGRYVAHDQPLAALVEAFRPYRAGIVTLSADAAKLRISGVFELADLDGALSMVQQLFPIRITDLAGLFTRIDLPGR